ncbi:MAG: ATP-dependent helicase HrpB [Rhodothermales bacterium]|nr:ATP-dependent helicase HrpB [Rhodothermales bacterium]
MTDAETSLPVQSVLPELKEVLRKGTDAVLQAPPGAGKTTLVPPALLDEEWLSGRKIVVLEPRRLAARASARRMASLLGTRVGGTVGYRVRMDTKVGPGTRIEVVTEGVLTRMIQNDPTIENVGAVIFDEFHERSLQADLGLALVVDARKAFRPDLRVLVMSATLDGARVSATFGGCPVITSEGRVHPVETYYRDRTVEGRTEDAAVDTVRCALSRHEGDMLVFFPGSGEIRRVAEKLGRPGDDVDVYALYGGLSFRDQDRAIEPSPEGRRKIVLATDIAETSLTIEGVRVVVDTGLVRRPRFDPSTGMTRLVTRKTSRSSADQRRGRAGRTAPGVCYRLWTELEQTHRDEFAAPEIVHADLAPLMLELACWGVSDPGALVWMDEPPPSTVAGARTLLRDLKALDDLGTASQHGRDMAAIGVHPRLAHMLISAREQNRLQSAADIAALVSERDILLGGAERAPSDIRLRLQLLDEARSGGKRSARYVHGHEVHRGALDRVLKLSAEFVRKAGASTEDVNDGAPAVSPAGEAVAGRLVALAYPDRIAQLRSGRIGAFRLRNGQAARLPEHDPLAASDFLAVSAAGGLSRPADIWQAAPLSADDIEDLFGRDVRTSERVDFDAESRRVLAVRRRSLDAVILSEGPVEDPDPVLVKNALLDGLRELGPEALPWTDETRRLRERLQFMHVRNDDWPDRSDAALMRTLDAWLGPFVDCIRSVEDLKRIEFASALMHGIAWDRRGELDRRAPSHIEVPSGSHIRIDYGDPESPVLAVRLQEMFGLTETPTVDRGRVPLTLHLLSPAHRPVQVTSDIASFWRDAYFDVRKDMRGRYPKHYWPEDPLSATPTSRAKPRSR